MNLSRDAAGLSRVCPFSLDEHCAFFGMSASTPSSVGRTPRLCFSDTDFSRVSVFACLLSQ